MKDEPYLQSQLSCTSGHVNEVFHLNKSMKGSWTESQLFNFAVSTTEVQSKIRSKCDH